MERLRWLLSSAFCVAILAVACTQAPPAPTAVPVPPTAAPAAPAAAPAVPTKAPAGAGAAPAATAAPAPAKAQWTPERGKSVSMIVPFAAGGAADIGGRMVSAVLEKQLGVTFQLVNKTGAGGQQGLTELTQAKADGYTMAVIAIPSSQLTYLDPERKAVYGRKDFAPLALYLVETTAIAVKADGPFKTSRDIFDAAKAQPATIKVGDGGLKTASNMAALLVAKAAGVKFAHVHFTGGAPALTALMGGHIDAAIMGAGNMMSYYKSGQLRITAVLDTQQDPRLPGITTLESQGQKVQFPITYGLALPGGVPKEILDGWDLQVKIAMGEQDLRKKMEEAGLEPRHMGAADFARYWDQIDEQMRPLIQISSGN